MTAKILDFARPVNGVIVEQKRADGFINGTAMCVAHGKDISDWLALDSTFEFVAAVARRFNIQPNSVISPNSLKTRVSATYPTLVIVKRGSPEFGGGTWIHPKLATNLAQKCNADFALLVSDWVEEWILTGRNPVQPEIDQEMAAYEQRFNTRIELKDHARPELMDAVKAWGKKHGRNLRKLCPEVHNVMNKRIQGYESRQIKAINGLPIASFMRDFFGATPLDVYLQINRIARNLIVDRDQEPTQAVNEACDIYLGKSYVPALTPILENLYVAGRNLKARRNQKQLPARKQLSFFDELSA